MDGSIARVHSRYRMAGQSSPAAVQARLDRIVQSEMPEVLERLLDQALAGDPTVYVLRRVHASGFLRIQSGVPGRSAVEQLGRRYAGAIMAAIIRAAPDDCVTFPNRAEYVASFLRELVRGSAWDNWVYCGFRRFRDRTVAEAVCEVFSENRECLAEILAALHRIGGLNEMIRALPASVLESLWSRELSTLRAADSLLPLFSAAFEIAERLALWPGTAPDRHRLFQRWSATHNLVADWGSRAELTAIVIGILRWFQERGLTVAASGGGSTETLAGMDWLDTDASRGGSTETLAGMDWLDTDALASALGLEHRGRDAASTHTDVPQTVPGSDFRPARRRSTPRQAALVEQLLPLIADLPSAPHALDTPETRVRLYALLIAAHPEWAGVEIVAPLIERLLAAAAVLAQCASPSEARRALLRGEVPAPALQIAADLGRPAIDVIARLATVSESTDEIQSDCAGIFLLLRAVMALRLSAASHAANYAPMPPILAALALQFAGKSGLRNGAFDPAIPIFSGWEGTAAELRSFWAGTDAAAHERFDSELRRIMESQRLAWDRAPVAEIGARTEEPLDPAFTPFGPTADRVLRAWARWLRGFSESSAAFLLKNFIRRPGILVRSGANVDVRLASSPFDIVLELAGYFDPIPHTPGLMHIGVRFQRSRRP